MLTSMWTSFSSPAPHLSHSSSPPNIPGARILNSLGSPRLVGISVTSSLQVNVLELFPHRHAAPTYWVPTGYQGPVTCPLLMRVKINKGEVLRQHEPQAVQHPARWPSKHRHPILFALLMGWMKCKMGSRCEGVLWVIFRGLWAAILLQPLLSPVLSQQHYNHQGQNH